MYKRKEKKAMHSTSVIRILIKDAVIDKAFVVALEAKMIQY